jgi:serine/threonine-protein kinase
VESLLGVGGFAWVYAATDPDLDITVALKVLKPQFAGNTEFEERFRREASTAAKLKHPNIIKIYTVGSEDHAVYFAMDLFTQKLTQQISVMGCLPEPAVLRLGLNIASALGFAHRQGVIHRDIKTDNILFDDHGNAIVADFGIARAAAGYAEQTGTNVIMGTPQFFAPEQARGQQIDARADVYSLGVTLYVAATGELPFSGTDWYEVARKHVEEAPPSPRSLNPGISAEMERVILKCMEKDRENRYATADLLYGELEALARRRAGEDSAATILVSTPVTGRYQTIQAPKKSAGSRLTGVLMFAGALAAAAAVYVGVDSLNGGSGPRLPMVGIASGGSVADPDAGKSVDPGGGGGAAGGSSSSGGSGGGLAGADSVVRPILSIAASPEATILINGVAVGIGTWATDTLPAGRYTIAAQLAVVAGCRWGRDETLLIYNRDTTSFIQLAPLRCGYLGLTATRDSRNIEASYEVTTDNGESLVKGRLPHATSIPIPVGKGRLWLTVAAPLCNTFRDSLLVVADSTVRRSIPMDCGGAALSRSAPFEP